MSAYAATMTFRWLLADSLRADDLAVKTRCTPRFDGEPSGLDVAFTLLRDPRLPSAGR